MVSLSELADLVGGTLIGDDSLISGASSIQRSKKNEITFVSSTKYISEFLESDACAAVTNLEVADCPKSLIKVENVLDAFGRVVEVFQPQVKRQTIGVSPQAIVSPSAEIALDASVYPGAVIMDNVKIGSGTTIFPNVTIMEGCVIGSNTRIFPNVTLYENTKIGDRVIVHAGAVLGAFGFGYDSSSGGHRLSSQLGNVVIEDDVEIGANTTIDRGTFDSTWIGKGSKLDNLVMVGHNCEIGEHNMFCSQVGIAGSCNTGNYVVMGGQVGLADHLTISANVSIAAKSGLMHDVEKGAKMFGIPARPAREQLQLVALQSKLPDMKKTISGLVRRVSTLESQFKSSENRAA
ncbi:MAG: UDP-3-O-(3-hydroxymyristoyl)glucosamine N-acyltransferase [Planctomycetota bacterium]